MCGYISCLHCDKEFDHDSLKVFHICEKCDDAFELKIKQLEGEIERLRNIAACAYCGKEYLKGDLRQIAEHAINCDKNPFVIWSKESVFECPYDEIKEHQGIAANLIKQIIDLKEKIKQLQKKMEEK